MITTPSAHTPKDIYIGDGTTVEFPVSFDVDHPRDIVVFLKLVDETEKRQIRSLDYVVREETDGSFTVVMRDDDYRDPPAAGVMIVIQMDMSFTQPSGRSNMSAHVFRGRIDSLTRQHRQVREQLDRTLYVGTEYPDYALRSPVYLNEPDPNIVAVGQAQMMRSRDGLVWEEVANSYIEGHNFSRMVYSRFYERFITLDTSNNIYRSDDRSGATWESGEVETLTNSPVDVKENPDTGTLICPGSTGIIARSTDCGLTWSYSADQGTALSSCLYIPWLALWLIYGPDTDRCITSADDGLTWSSAITMSGAISVTAWGLSPTAMMNADSSGGGGARIARSENTTAWTLESTPGGGEMNGISWGNGIWLTVGTASATAHGGYSLNDGLDWTATLLTSQGLNLSYHRSTFVQRINLFLAIKMAGDASAIRYSSDCVNWSAATTPNLTGTWLDMTSDSPADLE